MGTPRISLMGIIALSLSSGVFSLVNMLLFHMRSSRVWGTFSHKGFTGNEKHFNGEQLEYRGLRISSVPKLKTGSH